MLAMLVWLMEAMRVVRVMLQTTSYFAIPRIGVTRRAAVPRKSSLHPGSSDLALAVATMWC